MTFLSKALVPGVVLLAFACGSSDDVPPTLDQGVLDKGGNQGSDLAKKPDSKVTPPKDQGVQPDSCMPACQGKACGPDGCGGVCGTCPQYNECCSGTCVAPPPECTCTCGCKLVSNPNCASTKATSKLPTWDCKQVCQNACSYGCGGMTSYSGDCPPTAKCP
jgi:hypothetical protein